MGQGQRPLASGLDLAGDQDHELVAAEARHGLALAHLQREALGDALQETIPDRVPEAVVDCLEAVEVQEQQRDAAAVRPGVAHRLREALVQHVAVGQPGERVEAGLAVQRLALQGVGERERQALRQVLSELGYVDGWSVTDRGESLRTLYNEFDLLLAETIRGGDLGDLDAPTLAAVLSVFTYEARGGDVSPAPDLQGAIPTIDRILERWAVISEVEERHGVEPRRQPDYGLVDVIHGWTSGHQLEDLFEDEDLRAGDFVRSARQLLDLMRRIRDAYPALTAPLSEAVRAVDRGIVSTELVL